MQYTYMYIVYLYMVDPFLKYIQYMYIYCGPIYIYIYIYIYILWTHFLNIQYIYI